MENFSRISMPCFRALDATKLILKTKQTETKTSLCQPLISLSVASRRSEPHLDNDPLHNDLYTLTMTTCDCLTKTLLKSTQVKVLAFKSLILFLKLA